MELKIINSDYCLLCSSFYLKSGQITDENSLEMFRDNLIRSALIDLKKIEEIIRVRKVKNFTKIHVLSVFRRKQVVLLGIQKRF